jgi:4-diphosphocytidyl-2-C-methyl-D-erythritol kinase
MLPAVGVPESKTAALYARLRPGDYTDGTRTGALVECLGRGGPVEDKQLFNVFEGIAYSIMPGLNPYRRAMLSAGVARVHLAGSGPSLFSLHSSREEAEAVARRLHGWPVVVADTLAPGEACIDA